ncbi:uncharacterized protein LOC126971898 [Leptidea sinapis]|uniref:uncharacterized protein LOC126971898 n=1 Tax=Leptidea sinapis TaxID=189913 RepID=UPI0021448553|nr:uncharacterized protein LOC126971898 [Leptidea sinapis]
MGVKLIILLGLLIGLLYCVHILVKDYQAITAAKVFRLLFKRDLNSQKNNRANVRWRKILQYDKIQCIQMLFCDLGQSLPDTQLKREFIEMLRLEPRAEDLPALTIFQLAYNEGMASVLKEQGCRQKYTLCPFEISFLYNVINYLLKTG